MYWKYNNIIIVQYMAKYKIKKVFRDSVYGLTKPTIKKLVLLAGIKNKILGTTYDEYRKWAQKLITDKLKQIYPEPPLKAFKIEDLNNHNIKENDINDSWTAIAIKGENMQWISNNIQSIYAKKPFDRLVRECLQTIGMDEPFLDKTGFLVFKNYFALESLLLFRKAGAQLQDKQMLSDEILKLVY